MPVKINNESDERCACGETHKGHICWLSRMGLIMEVQHLSDNPTVVCSRCGAKANLAHNICFPPVAEVETSGGGSKQGGKP